jgi:cell division protein FtsZ
MAADSVLTLANDRLEKLVDETRSVTELLAVSDELVAHGIRGLWQLITRRGLIPLGLPELQNAIRGRHTESAFAVAEAAGEGRTQAVIDKLLRHPLLDEGRALAGSESIIVSIVAGPELTPSEIGRIKDHVQREAEKADVTVGAVCDDAHAGRLSVILIVTRRAAQEDPDSREDVDVVETAGQLAPMSTPRPSSGPAHSLKSSASDHNFELADKSTGRRRRKRHESLQPELALQVIPRGRFDKSEPTVHGGSDLDVPSYIRRNVSLVDFPSLS